jgi:hypothetical protein
MHASSSVAAIRALVPDRLAWNARVWTHDLGSFAEKAMFVKKFMYANARASNWVQLFDRGSALMMSTLRTPQTAVGAGGGSDSRRIDNRRINNRDGRRDNGRYDRDNRQSDNRRYDRDTRNRDGRDTRNRDGNRNRSKLANFCITRLDPSKGRCSAGRSCSNDHHCPCCNALHNASACPSFDPQKARRVAEDRRRAVRG